MHHKSAVLDLDPIVPFHMFLDTQAEQIEDIISLSEKSGIRRFVLTYPNLGVRIDGMAQPSQFDAFADMLASVKEQLAPHGIEVGWWCAPSLNAGSNPYSVGHAEYENYNVQRIVNLDGAVSPAGGCPLDSRFQRYLSENVKLVAGRVHPFVIFFEDDFQVSNHSPVTYGCFCPLHLDAFAKRIGQYYSREELFKIFIGFDAKSAEFRRAWAETVRDSLVEMATAIRNAVDQVAPDTRLALCQPGGADMDGDMTESVARAFGGNSRPMIRLYGSSYSSDEAWILPRMMFHFLHSRQTLGPDIECIHESDTYPHTRYFMSATKLEAMLAVATLYGADGSLLYITQYLDNPNEDVGYQQLLRKDTSRLNALKQAASGCRVLGVEAVYRPRAHVFVPIVDDEQNKNDKQFHRPISSSAWPQVLGLMGVAYTAHGGRPKVISGAAIMDFNDAELEELFSGGVLLDGKAAWHMTQMGRSDLMGIEAHRNSSIRCLYEQIVSETPWPNPPHGRLMYNMAIAPAGAEGSNFYNISVQPGTRVITQFLGAEKNVIAPAWTLFENHLAGRVAVTAFDLEQNRSSSIYNYRRKWLLRHTLEWIGNAPLPVYVENDPNIFCIAAESSDQQYVLVAITNLSTDTCPCIHLAVQDSWAQRDILLLDAKGQWCATSAALVKQNPSGSSVIRIDHSCEMLRPTIIKLIR